MTEEEFSALGREDKMNLIRFLVADIAERLLSEDETTVQKAQHELGNLAMVFMNMHYLITSDPGNSREMIRSIYEEYRSQPSTNLNLETGQG